MQQHDVSKRPVVEFIASGFVLGQMQCRKALEKDFSRSLPWASRRARNDNYAPARRWQDFSAGI